MNVDKEKISVTAPELDFSAFGPFSIFLAGKRGLRSFQPTLLWQVSFIENGDDLGLDEESRSHLQETIFTDNITVPGESLSTDGLNLNPHSIPYLVFNNRSTQNTFSVGFYVDVYNTVERVIYPWMKHITLNGIRQSTIDINLYGFRMGNDSSGEEYSVFHSDSEMDENHSMIPNGDVENTTRKCYIYYSFKGCFPQSVPEYTYDQQNQKWANVRQVTFGFRDYDVQLFKTDQIKTGPESFGCDDLSKNIESKFSYGGTTHLVNKQLPRYYNEDDGSISAPANKDGQHDIFDLSWWAGHVSSDLNPLSRNDNSDGVHKEYKLIYTSPEHAWPMVRYPFAYETDQYEGQLGANAGKKGIVESTYAFKSGELETFQKTNLIVGSRNDKTKNKDATEQFKKAEGMIKNLVKTFVKAYVTPDTPLYHGGIRADVSRAIGKVQQWFFKEPKNKVIPTDDHISMLPKNSGARFYIEPKTQIIPEDDHPNLLDRDEGVPVEIEYMDHAAIHTHKADTIKIPELDYDNVQLHTGGNQIRPDQNDTTVLTGHSGNDKPIPADDHTLPTSHSGSSEIEISDDDHLSINKHEGIPKVDVGPDYIDKHGNVDGLFVIDPNDYIQNHKSIDPIVPDENDAGTTHAPVDEINVDENDSVDSKYLRTNEVTVPEDDIPSKDISANTIEIDENDAVGRMGKSKYSPLQLLRPGGVANNPLADAEPENKEPKVDPNKDVVKMEDLMVDEIEIDDKDTVIGIDVKPQKTVAMPDQNDSARGSLVEIDKKQVADDAMDSGMVRIREVLAADDDGKIPNVNVERKEPKDSDLLLKHDEEIDSVLPEPSNLTKHEKVDSIIDFSKDSVDSKSIRIREKRSERSILDFAKMILNERKSETSERVTSHGEADEINNAEDDKLISHSRNVTLINRPDEPQAITRDHEKINYVDPHANDHTRINVNG